MIIKDNILVTGANGLVGSHILKSLIECGGQNIHAMVRPSSDLTSLNHILPNITLHTGDILDFQFLDEIFRNVEYIIHTAGLVSYDPKRKKQLYQVNEEGTANVVNSASQQNIVKIVHISSIASLGRKKNSTVIDETCQWVESDYNTDYARSKYLGEQQVWRAYYEGLNSTILNPSVILGSGNWHRSSLQLVSKLDKGTPFYPMGSTGFVDVEDLAQIAIESLNPTYDGERYIINGFNMTFKSIFDKITMLLNRKSPSIPLTKFWANIGWRLESVRSTLFNSNPLLTRNTALSSSLPLQYDNHKSIQHFNHNYMPSERTISSMVEAYISQK